MKRLKQIAAALALSVLTATSYPSVALASQANSSNYGVSEVQFGSGGELHACSTTYCAKQSAGELTVGNTKSTNYQAQAGFNSNRDPYLNVNVSGSVVDFGVLDPTTTTARSTVFNVKTYLASGYNVYIDGTTLKNSKDGRILPPMATAAAPTPGTEQFGINLRANTAPAIGADPVQVPDSTFSFGSAATGYNTANNFKYIAGDKIAGSTSSSGETDYTMSMIANASTFSSAGTYNGRLVINVIPTF